MSADSIRMEDEGEDILLELLEVKRKANLLAKRVLGENQAEEEPSGPPDIEEIRDLLAIIIEKQNRMETTFGVEKINLKDIGDKILVTLETSFGQFTTHADKNPPSPVTYSGSTVAGGAGQTVVGGAKGGGPAGMTPDQLQEFKKQSLQIGAVQQKLKELEIKLTEAAMAAKKSQDKNTDMEEKSNEHVRELYVAIDSINTSLSEKIALQKVEVQKIAGDTPKPINYDPFNYGEAYAGDLVDFQARKRITELKLLVHGLQTALLQMKDSMKVSPSIDLGYKVVRLDELVGSTGFGQKVNNGEVATDEALLVTQSKERLPGKIEYPRKSMNQTSSEMESKWAITDSIMQTMYRLEMELGEIQKIVDSSGMSSSSKVVEELQQSIKQLKEKQIDMKTIKRLIEDSKDNSAPLMSSSRWSMPVTRSALPQTNSESNYDALTTPTRKLEISLRNMQTAVNNLSRRVFGSKKQLEASMSAAGTKKRSGGRLCLSCDRAVKGDGIDVSRPTLPMYSFFSPTGASPRVRGPVQTQYTLAREYAVNTSSIELETYTIPRPCGGGYSEFWPLPKSFNPSRFQAVYEPPSILKDVKYVKGTDGRYYRGQQICYTEAQLRHFVPMSIISHRGKDVEKEEFQDKVKVWKLNNSSKPNQVSDNTRPLAVIVMAASEEKNLEKSWNDEAQKDTEEPADITIPVSNEHKKYRFYVGTDEDDEKEKNEKANQEAEVAVKESDNEEAGTGQEEPSAQEQATLEDEEVGTGQDEPSAQGQATLEDPSDIANEEEAPSPSADQLDAQQEEGSDTEKKSLSPPINSPAPPEEQE